MAKKTVVLIHNGQVLVNTLKEICDEKMPDYNIINIIDESLVRDIIAYRGVKPHMTRRITRYALSAQDLGASAVVMTCSSLGETVDAFSKVIDIPAFKIDEPMYAYVAKKYNKVALMGTLHSVIGPGERQLKKQAQINNKEVIVTNCLCEQAFLELIQGNRNQHDQILLNAAKEIAGSVDAIVLAQGSMAKMASQIEELTGKPTLTCLEMGIESIAKELRKIHKGV